MARTVSIGNQDFELIQKEGYFYIDKTNFIKEWWESGDSVTLITRPRRFGKTLNMSMLEPRQKDNNAIILEFKVQGTDEKELADTVQDALRQIDEKNYQANLVAKGIPKERIRKYGFAFCGKKVLIGGE